ncbi:MAG: bifunctional 5,10-methylene-tetrahydrofolate dehydrogenase/5,10-methylene-tetrahydrofolate cyclohydrolase [Verrucomicrobia bacterium RIFCSPLOWO2_12_FULL_64_8]|nr:MAG: bifunctional 5,10-methylene-tetrahydrofolate dehydrogenase/5,10-methylene-tetrahydrofolate cyclohydrolase [Verrucomicrobia bacterium RIFCSPLOWO2_12_FULL_64_8]
MELIDGNKIAADIIAELKAEVAAQPPGSPRPCIAFIRVGEDPASVSYVNKKNQTAAAIGLTTRLELLPAEVPATRLYAVIDALNADPAVHGILIQSPLPSPLDEIEAFRRVRPEKDVDGLGTMNLGKIAQDDESGFVSCTPGGIMELLARSGVKLAGRHVVVLGRSLLVGKPVALLAMQKKAWANATVTVCHSQTADLPAVTRTADVLIAAIGRAEFVTAAMVRPGVVVIDVGINRVADPARKSGYRLVGDVHFASVAPLAGKITPVPGGVGPMTVAMLMKNTIKACRLQTAA